MNCVILQPSYIPWRGYFHQIEKADLFVFYDDVQYDRSGWRNRNRIKTPQGARWLSIPVHHRGSRKNAPAIREIQICWDQPWSAKHLKSLQQAYGRAPHFERYAPILIAEFKRCPKYLADLTIDLTIALAREMGITHTQFSRASDLDARGEKTDRVLSILEKVGATHYISGPSARDYLEEEKLAAAGITLEYMVYEYPEYPQLYPPFDPQVTILDLLFMTGTEAGKYIWGDQPRDQIDDRS